MNWVDLNLTHWTWTTETTGLFFFYSATLVTVQIDTDWGFKVRICCFQFDLLLICLLWDPPSSQLCRSEVQYTVTGIPCENVKMKRENIVSLAQKLFAKLRIMWRRDEDVLIIQFFLHFVILFFFFHQSDDIKLDVGSKFRTAPQSHSPCSCVTLSYSGVKNSLGCREGTELRGKSYWLGTGSRVCHQIISQLSFSCEGQTSRWIMMSLWFYAVMQSSCDY